MYLYGCLCGFLHMSTEGIRVVGDRVTRRCVSPKVHAPVSMCS